MRCFVAIDLADDLKGSIAELQNQIRHCDVKLAGDPHFTLKFLGEVGVKTVHEVSRQLKDIANRTKPFDINVEKIGVFPSDKFIRVVWIGAPELLNLQIVVQDALGKDEFKPTPHLTIARIGSSSSDLTDFIHRNRDVVIGKMHVNCIKLKKSILTSKGPVYEDIKIFNIGTYER